MASTARVFFAGVATSVLLIGAGFGGGVALKTAMDVPQKVTQAKAASSPEASSPDKAPPPARVVLPAMTDEASAASAQVPPIQAAIPPAPPQVTPQPEAQLVSGQDVHVKKRDIEKEKQASRQAEAEKQQAERAEQHKKAAERERRHGRYADRRARQEAARQQQEQQHEQQQQQEVRHTEQFGILAFDRSDEPPMQSFFGD